MGDWAVEFGVARNEKCPSSGYSINPDWSIANTKGSWTELLSSTSFKSKAITVQLINCSYATEALVDIGIGSAGNEKVILENLIYSCKGAFHQYRTYHFPITIQSGIRIAARGQGTYNGTNRVRVAAHLYESDFIFPEGAALVTTYGDATGDSGGKSIDPGASAGTKGSWVQLAASLDYDIKGFVLGIGNQNITRASSTYYWIVDVGVGGSGSEKVVFKDWSLSCYNGTHVPGPTVTPFIPVKLPAGSRISVRAACSGTNAAYRKFDAVLYCVS